MNTDERRRAQGEVGLSAGQLNKKGRLFMLYEKIKPMEPVPGREPFDSTDHLFQVKWDGVRILAFIDHGTVRLQNRKLRDRTHQYPELQVLPRLLSVPTAILDGELVAFREGKPVFPRIMRRDMATREQNIAVLVENIPVTYILFDVLYLDGKDVTNQPLTERQFLLSRCFSPSQEFFLTDNFSEGKALFSTVQDRGLEGIVAKLKTSRYFKGKHRDWVKVKCRRRMLCVVGGYTRRGQLANALLVGAYDNQNLIYLGKVGSGLSTEEWRTITGFLAEMSQEQSPFYNPPLDRANRIQWVTPVLTVIVEFSEWTENAHLRAPVIAGFITAPPEQCVLL